MRAANPRSLGALDQPDSVRDQLVRCVSARVVYADYRSLQQDFPQLQASSLVERFPTLRSTDLPARRSAMRAIIDGWLLNHAGFVSRGQTTPNGVNSAIFSDGRPALATRPPRYGRAVVVSLRDVLQACPKTFRDTWRDQPDGLLDLKGAGVGPNKAPSAEGHSNGLLTLGKALSSSMFGKILRQILASAPTAVTVLPEYGIIDLGFNLMLPSGEWTPAGLVVRRAHCRPRGGLDLPRLGSIEQQVQIAVEMLLRQFGVTSCSIASRIRADLSRLEGANIQYGTLAPVALPEHALKVLQGVTGWRSGLHDCDAVNIQMARHVSLRPLKAELIDLGHFEVRASFNRPIVSVVRDAPFFFGGIIGPEDADFVTCPISTLAVPYDLWGSDNSLENGGESPPVRLGFALAGQFREGSLSGDCVRKRVEQFVASGTAQLQRQRPLDN